MKKLLSLFILLPILAFLPEDVPDQTYWTCPNGYEFVCVNVILHRPHDPPINQNNDCWVCRPIDGRKGRLIDNRIPSREPVEAPDCGSCP